MEGLIIFIILYLIIYAFSGKKTKNTKNRNIVNEVTNFLKVGPENLIKKVSDKKYLEDSILKYIESPRQQTKNKSNLYKKTISIPIDILPTGDGYELWVNASMVIYIRDLEQYKLVVWNDEEIVSDIIIYHIYTEASIMLMNDLMDTKVLKERVNRNSKSDLISMWIEKIDLNINTEIISKDGIYTRSVNSYTSIDGEVDYAKQITDELMKSIWETEKDIENTVKKLEKDMDDFEKSLSS